MDADHLLPIETTVTRLRLPLSLFSVFLLSFVPSIHDPAG